MDELIKDQDPKNNELARRVQAYADARLSPEPEAMKRIRSVLVARAGGSARTHVPLSRRAWQRPPARRLGMSLVAAALVLAIAASVVVAARPGGPLYSLMLWVESVTLPADPSARAAAEIGRLETRLVEAWTASTAGDAEALSAVLGAYTTNLDSVISGGVPDAVGAELEAALARHVMLLEALSEQGPEPARSAIEHAIERGTEAIDRLLERHLPPSGDPPVPGDSPADGDGPDLPTPPEPAGPDGAPTAGPDAAPSAAPEQAPPSAAPVPAPPSAAPELATPAAQTLAPTPGQSPSAPRP